MSKTTLAADIRPTKKYLVDGITKDITIEACIFDLIDNSIDAFQENISGGLPNDYKSYCIEIEINSDEFLIRDSGVGISRNFLVSNALRFGSHSHHHDTSIGFYGIGLNRALLKLGKISIITTETKTERSQLTLNAITFVQNDDDWSIPIASLDMINELGTTIKINDLNSDVKDSFSNTLWIQKLTDNVSKRYTEFLNKNLKIIINSKDVNGYSINIKKNGGFKPRYKTFELNSIKVIIELGQHSAHLFPYEKKEGISYNNPTRQECGWNVFCNDRTVKLFDWSADTGWETKVHSEHNGFIGKVYFIGNAGKLPWNTSKTDIDLNNNIYK